MGRRLTVALLPLAVLVAGASIHLLREARSGGPGFPIDDSFIYLVFARNVAEGRGFVYNPGEPTTGATALLWTALLAPLQGLPLDPILGAKALGLLLLALATAGVGMAVRRATGSVSLGAGAACAAAAVPRLLWGALAAMDVPLGACLVAWALAFFFEPPSGRFGRLATPVLLGLALFARPETVLLFPAFALAASLAGRDGGRPPDGRAAGRLLLFGALASTALASAYYAIAGDPLPSSFRAKVGRSPFVESLGEGRVLEAGAAIVAGLPAAAWKLTLFLHEDQPLLLPIGILGGGSLLLGLRRGGVRARLAAAPLGLLAYAFGKELAAPSFNDLLFQHGRQAAPVSILFLPCVAEGVRILLGAWIPLRPGAVPRARSTETRTESERGALAAFALAAALVLWRFHHPPALRPAVDAAVGHILLRYLAAAAAGLLVALLARRRRPGDAARIGAVAASLVLGGLLLGDAADRLRRAALEYGDDVDRIQTMHVALGRWIEIETPADAVVAANDVGAIAYYGRRPLIDLFGLITPDVVAYRYDPALPDLDPRYFRERRRPDLLVVFPSWFPRLLASEADRLEEVHRVEIDPNVTTGDRVKVVYRYRNP